MDQKNFFTGKAMLINSWRKIYKYNQIEKIIVEMDICVM